MEPNNERRELTDEALNKKFSIMFTRKELTILYNIIHRTDDGSMRAWALPDARILLEIVDKIHGPVASLSNQDYKKPEKTPNVAVN